MHPFKVFQLNAQEVAQMDDDLVWEFSKRHEFRLASMNGRVREAMLDAMVEENGIEAGWFYWFVWPGCLPDSEAIGPFPSAQEAFEAAKADQQEGSEPPDFDSPRVPEWSGFDSPEMDTSD